MKRFILCVMILCVAWCGLLTWWTLRPPAPLNEVRWPIKNAAWIQKYGTGPESQACYDIYILGQIVTNHSKRIMSLEDVDKSDPNDAQ